MDPAGFQPGAWALLAAAAFVMGMSKGGLPGVAMVAIPWVSDALGARAATGFTLPMLIAGDLLALLWFRRAVSVADLLRALPWAAAGVFAGWWLLRVMPSGDGGGKIMDYAVAGIVLFILALQVARKFPQRGAAEAPAGAVRTRRAFSIFMGFLGGVTTTLANAAGPVMSAYFLGLKLSKATFIGTCAWFFFIINWLKFPLMAAEGMITAPSLRANLFLVPVLYCGVFAGIFIVKRVDQKAFEWLVTILAAAGCVKLLM